MKDYKSLRELTVNMSKLLISDNNEDRQIAYNVLISKLDSIDRINRFLFEARINIVLVGSDNAGLTYQNVNGWDIGICHLSEHGLCTYKYIKSK